MLSYILVVVACPCAKFWLNTPISLIKTSLLGTLHHRGWSVDVDSLSAHFWQLVCIGLVSVRDIMIKRHCLVTSVVSTGQTHNFGNLRPAIP